MERFYFSLFVFIYLIISISYTKTYQEYYRDYSFRNCIINLLSNTNFNNIDYYILANSYFQLKDYSNAGVYFSKITTDSFKNDIMKDFFVYSYFNNVRKAIDSDKFIVKDYLGLSNFLKALSNSIFYNEVEDAYLWLLWRAGLFDKILSFNTSNRVYPVVASIILTNFESVEDKLETFHIPYLIDYFEIINPEIFEKLRVKDFEEIVFHLLNRNKYSEARKMLELYLHKWRNYDFYNRNIAYLNYKCGDKKEAIDYLEKYVRNGRMVSWKSFQTLLDILLREGYIERAYDLIKKFKDFYAPTSYAYWIRVSKKADKYLELYDWYKKISKRVEILPEQKREIFRVLLRNDLSLAKRMAGLISVNEKDYHYYLYVSALIDYYKNNKESAYRKFLEVILNYPFTYEWIMSLKFEKELRLKNYEWFRLKFRKKMISLREKDNFSKKDCLFIIALDFIDLPLNAKTKMVLVKKLQDTILEFRKEFKENFKISSTEFKKFFELEENLLDFMTFERLLLIDRFIATKKPVFFYNYFDFLTNRGLFDFSVGGLNYYFTRLVDGRENLFLLERDDLLKAFPTNYLDIIEKIMDNHTNSLLTLSLLREESHFKKDAVSSAGAIGVAQVMPQTFNIIKERLKMNASIYDFEDNLKLGIIHFNNLINRYSNWFYALAAYNSGESAVNNWIKKYNFFDELWVECIEYNETYYYVRKIMFSYFMYCYLVNTNIEIYSNR